MAITQPIILITDLDGTLLDHTTYQFDAAGPALELLKQLQIPLILSSSKTAAEIIATRDEMDNHNPFVVENGSGIYYPVVKDGGHKDYNIVRFGKNRPFILAALRRLREEFNLPFCGFDDMTVQAISKCTGLKPERAALAKKRDFTEPLLWQGNTAQWKFFCSELELEGLIAVKGGRFMSVSGKTDKGLALQWLRDYYQQRLRVAPVIVALGDSENDRQMLERADYAILVRSPSHSPPQIDAKNLTITSDTGPQGWNKSVIDLLKHFELLDNGSNHG
ncbi:MAG: HAD-IIB family hydrolase [Gammaproteobacteria bacterium]